MSSNEQVFRHPIGKIALGYILLLLVIFFTLIISRNDDGFILACFSPAFVLGSIVALFYLPYHIKISDAEITVGRLFGSNTLHWSEIGRVSMRGQSLRLHDRDGSTTLFLNSQLTGFLEVLDIIYDKRPDLFDLSEENILSGNSLSTILQTGFGIGTILLSIYLFVSQNQDVDRVLKLVVLGIGVVFIGSWLLTPQIILEGQTLCVKYPFKAKLYQASEINWLSLDNQGGSLYIRLNLDTRKVWVRAPKYGSAISYQFIRRWHEQAVSRK